MVSDGNANQVFQVQAVPKTIQERAIDLAFAQGLPFLLACLAVYYLYNDIKTQIPQHLKTMTVSYETIADLDRQARGVDAQHMAEVIRINSVDAKQHAEQLERLFQGKLNSVVRRVDATEQKIEGLAH
jgi:hypothetical protein